MKLSDFKIGKTTLNKSMCSACYSVKSAAEISTIYVGMVREDEIDMPYYFCTFDLTCRDKILAKATGIYEDRARRNALRRMGAFKIG